MNELPMLVFGAVTMAAFVVLGIFVYPALLKRRGGRLVLAGATMALTALFYWFDRSSNAAAGVSPATSAMLALLWAAAPAVVGVLVRHLQDKATRRVQP
jgi:hypothetical protein